MFNRNEDEFAYIGKPWWRDWRVIVFAISTILLLIFKDRVGTYTLSSAFIFWLVGNGGVNLAIAYEQELKYKSPNASSPNLHGSFNPTTVHVVGDYTVFTMGSILSEIPTKTGDFTVVIPTKLLITWGVNKIVAGSLTVATIEELPMEVRDFVRGVPYLKPPFLYTETPVNPREKNLKIEEDAEIPIDVSRITSILKSYNSTIATLQRLLGSLEKGAITVADFASSAKTLLKEPTLLEKLTHMGRGEGGKTDQQ